MLKHRLEMKNVLKYGKLHEAVVVGYQRDKNSLRRDKMYLFVRFDNSKEYKVGVVCNDVMRFPRNASVNIKVLGDNAVLV